MNIFVAEAELTQRLRIERVALTASIPADEVVGVAIAARGLSLWSRRRVHRWFAPLQKVLTAALLLGLPTSAFAHPGHGAGFLAAFAHPFTGLDHLLMMVFVGLWAGRSGRALRWLIPATFLLSMLGGWVLGSAGVALSGLDSGIAATLIVLGVLLVLQIQLRPPLQLGLVAAFALLHGLAHGGELADSAWLSAAGMLLATALLHGFGLAAAMLIPPQRNTVYRIAGAVLAAIGGGLLAAV